MFSCGEISPLNDLEIIIVIIIIIIIIDWEFDKRAFLGENTSVRSIFDF